jgi:hypothetical protein
LSLRNPLRQQQSQLPHRQSSQKQHHRLPNQVTAAKARQQGLLSRLPRTVDRCSSFNPAPNLHQHQQSGLAPDCLCRRLNVEGLSCRLKSSSRSMRQEGEASDGTSSQQAHPNP